MHHRYYRYLITAGLLSLALTGCGKDASSVEKPHTDLSNTETDLSDTETDQPSDTEEAVTAVRDHSDPAFKKALLPDSDNPALFHLPAELLSDISCTDLCLFGDNILLVDQAIYGGEQNGQGEDLGQSYEEEGFEYTFDFTIYDPWRNSITETLHLKQGTADAYQIIGQRLILFNYADSQAIVYDTSLQPDGEYNIADLQEVSSLNFIVSTDGSRIFSYGYELNHVLMIDPLDFTCSPLDVGLYNPTPEAVSPDGRYLIASGVDKESLRRSIVLYDTLEQKTHSSVDGTLLYGTNASDTGYLRYSSMEGDIYCYQSYDGQQTCFSCPDCFSSFLIGEDRMLNRCSRNNVEDNSSIASCILRDLQGHTLSSFYFDCGSWDDPLTSRQLASGQVYLEDADSVFFLAYRYDDNFKVVSPELLVWDLSIPLQEEADLLTASDEEELRIALGHIREDIFEPTLLEDPDSYDWGDLASCQEHANTLEDKLGITIYLGPEVPDTISEYSVAQQLDPEILGDALDMLDQQLSLYPENFFPQLAFDDNSDVCFYLTGHLTPNSDYVDFDPAAYVTEIDSHLIMVIDTMYTWDMAYTLNHELSHMIDRRLDFLSMYRNDCLYSESTWCSYNPETFSYLYDYVDYSGKADMETYGDWFIDNYGMTFPTEDRAMIFGYAMDAYSSDYDWRGVLNEDTVIYEKLGYYAQCIRDGFDSADWPEVLPWEKYLREKVEQETEG